MVGDGERGGGGAQALAPAAQLADHALRGLIVNSDCLVFTCSREQLAVRAEVNAEQLIVQLHRRVQTLAGRHVPVLQRAVRVCHRVLSGHHTRRAGRRQGWRPHALTASRTFLVLDRAVSGRQRRAVHGSLEADPTFRL